MVKYGSRRPPRLPSSMLTQKFTHAAANIHVGNKIMASAPCGVFNSIYYGLEI